MLGRSETTFRDMRDMVLMMLICALGIILSIVNPVTAFPTRGMKPKSRDVAHARQSPGCQSTEVWFERFLNLERSDIDLIDSRWVGKWKANVNRIGRHRIHNLMRLFIDVGVDSQSIKKVRTHPSVKI